MSLQTALSEYQMHQDPFGVLVIDLDRFKAINDGFGHATETEALN
jgi:diguanylate cyclase (GGDEF)-like protein